MRNIVIAGGEELDSFLLTQLANPSLYLIQGHSLLDHQHPQFRLIKSLRNKPLHLQWTPANSKHAYALLTCGNGLLTDKDLVVPVLYVRDMTDLTRVCSWLFRSKLERGFKFLFRGQTKDYFDSTGRLIIDPPLLRDPQFQGRSDFSVFDFNHLWEFSEEFKSLAEELGIPKTEYAYWGRNEGGTDWYKARGLHPAFVVLLQHYGVPTTYLDVTTEPRIALWFALRQCKKTDDNRLYYTKVNLEIRRTGLDLPSIYCFLCPPLQEMTSNLFKLPYVDVRNLGLDPKIIKRPYAQSACAIRTTVMWHPSPHPFPSGTDVASYTPPTKNGMILLIKSLWGFTEPDDLKFADLFPEDDPIYHKLLSIPNSKVAVYNWHLSS